MDKVQNAGKASAILIAGVVALLAAPAAAQSARSTSTKAAAERAAAEKAACVGAFDRGQRAQSDRALKRAQTELLLCAQETCPAVLKADCAGVLAEVRAALPTIVFAADDGNGHELTSVTVSAGNQLLTPTLDGRAIPVDPGTFELRFETAGRKPFIATRTIREGEKSRVIRVSIVGDREAVASGDPSRTPARDTLGWALPISLAAVGVAALGVSAFERLHFNSRVDELRGSCAPDCSQDERSDISGTVVVSNIALGVGIGALAMAVASWFLTAPPPASSTSRAAASRGPLSMPAPGRFTW